MTRLTHGFDYRTQQPLRCDRAELREVVEQIESSGGTHRRIAGDLTYFNARGVMVIELYDKAEQHDGL